MKANIKRILTKNSSREDFWNDLIYDKLWPITKWYFALVEPIQSHWCKFKRACAYFKHGYHSFDFDSAYMLEDMLFKLKRIQDSIINHGHHVVEKEEEQSLRLAIKLLDRQLNRNYGEYFRKKHDEKWGEVKIWFEDLEPDHPVKGSRLMSSRPNIKSKEDEEKELEDRKVVWKLEEELKMRDRKWLFDIIVKHMDRWWD